MAASRFRSAHGAAGTPNGRTNASHGDRGSTSSWSGRARPVRPRRWRPRVAARPSCSSRSSRSSVATSTAVLDTFYGFWTPGSSPRQGRRRDRRRRRGRRCASSAPSSSGRTRTVPALASPTTRTTSRSSGSGSFATPASASCCTRFVQAAEVRDGRVEAIIVATKAGPPAGRGLGRSSTPRGDADLCHFAGFGYELAGELEPAQTLTTTFRDGQRRPGPAADADQGASSTR